MKPSFFTPKCLRALSFITLLFFFGNNYCDAQTITTFAGGIGDDSLAATYGRLVTPISIAVDASGNLYISDQGNFRVRKVSASGFITTVAGNGVSGTTISGSAVYAEINPWGVGVDAAGNVYIAAGNSVLKLNAAGVLTLVAGTGTAGYSGDGGPAIAAQLNNPAGLCVDAAGDIFIADDGNARVRKVNTLGIITTIAGGGTGGIGDGGPATAANVNPYGVAVDAAGNVYIADQNNERIRKVNTSGIITTVAGNGTPGFSGDGGAATSAELYYPYDVKVDAAGNLYIPDKHNQRIRKVNTSGIINTIAGTGTAGYSGDGGPATAAELNNPSGLAIDVSGNVYVADQTNNRIRKISTSGIITTVAGNDLPLTGNSNGGGNVTLAELGDYNVTTLFQTFITTSATSNLSIDNAGNLIVVDNPNECIRKISPSGVITTIAGNNIQGFSGDGGPATAAELSDPSAAAVDKYGNIYIADFANKRIRKINTSGIITTFAGGGIAGLGDGGPATLAVISACGVAVDKIGNVYIADGTQARVRKVDTAGIISTVAGTGTVGNSGDGGPAISATLDLPNSVLLDRYGNLFISDLKNHNIRKVDTNGIISTYAHVGGIQIAIDSVGNIYVSTTTGPDGIPGNYINKIDPFGYITVVAGNTTLGYMGDNSVATASELIQPGGLAIDSMRNLYILQQGAVRKVCCMSNVIDHPPVYTHGATQTMSVCESSGAINIDTFLTITDLDTSNLEKWSIISAPTHGTLSGFVDSMLSTGGAITPSGLTYTPTAGYSGTDHFSIKISDGTDTALTTVTITISPLPNAGTIHGAASYICGTATLNLSETVSGGTWSSSNTSIATVGSTGIATGVAPGIDTIKYSISNSCGTSTATYPVTVNSTLAAITGSNSVCAGATTSLSDVTTGGTWSSSNIGFATVGSSGMVTGVATGIPTISYTLPSGCYATIPVTVNALPYVGPISGANTVCIGAPATLFDGGSGGIWSSSNASIAMVGSVTGIVTGLATGVTIISYTGTNSCGTVSAIYSVTVNTIPFAGTISGPSSVCTSSSITLSDAATGGGVWNSLSSYISVDGTSGVVSGIAPGTAIISYSVSNSCGTAVATTTVTVDASPSAGIITGAGIMCTGGTDTLSDAIPGGTWSTSTPVIISVSSTGVVTGLAAGAGVVFYTVSNACGNVETMTIVNVTAATPIDYITGLSSVCTGSTITLSDATPGGTWSSTDPAIGTISSSGIITGIAHGVTTISYTASLGCGLSVATAEITVETAASVAGISGSSAICMGADALLTDAAAGGVWSSSNSNATISTTGLITGLTAGTDIITYTVTNSCGSAFATFIVSVYATPVAGIVSGPSSVCAGLTITLSDAATGGVWSSSNTAIATVGTSGMVTGITAGTVVISYTVTTGCGIASATETITVNEASAGIITGVTVLCAGGTSTLNDPVAGGAWSSSATSVATISSTGVVNAIAGGTTIISYSLAGACGTAIATTVFTVGTLPVVSPVTGTTTLCTTATSGLADGTAGGTWSSSNTAIATVSSTGLVTGISAGSCVISYSITAGCGTSVATAAITINAPPSSGTISGIATVCQSATTTLSESIAGGAWSSSNTSIATVGAVTGVVSGVNTGTVIVSYTITNSCGTAYASKIMTVSPLPFAGTVSGTPAVCVGANITVYDAAPGGLWSSSNTSIVTVGSATGIATGVAIGSAIISYSVTNSCGAAFAILSVVVNPSPVVGAISGTASLCQSADITLTDAVAGGVWSSSNTTIAIVNTVGTVTGIDTGTVAISYTVSNSCGSVTATKAVTVLPAPYPGIITGINNICVGAVTTLSDLISGGTWSSAATSVATISAAGIVTGISSGADVISYTVANACGSSSATTNINIDPLPDIAAITGTIVVNLGGTANLYDAVSGGSWSSSNTSVATVNGSGIVTGISLGTAIITYTMINGFGCSIDTTILITVEPTTDINKLNGNNGYKLYPNPATNDITITWQNQTAQSAEIVITDMVGKEVFRNTMNIVQSSGSSQVNLAGIPDGAYIVTIMSASSFYTGKLVILKQ